MENEKGTIKLPDLDIDHEIVADNIRSLEPLYFAAMLEEMKVFQVVDKLVELFQSGRLPIGSGRAGGRLYKYWKDANVRISETERRDLYSRALGVPGGDSSGSPNLEFNDLWLRFVAEVSSFVRQDSVDLQERAISQDNLKKAARDLAANLSLHGYGWAYFVSRELQKQFNEMIGLLSDPEIRSAYGAQDMWQVIDRVAQFELGGARNTVRYRTLATSGATIIAWLGKNTKRLSSTARGPILAITKRGGRGSRRGGGPPTNPNDADLVNACENWLAARTDV